MYAIRSYYVFERPVTDNIAGQTRGPAESVGVRHFVGVVAAADPRPVRHLQDIRHVAGRRNVENGGVDLVVHDIEDLADEYPGTDGDRLSYNFV